MFKIDFQVSLKRSFIHEWIYRVQRGLVIPKERSEHFSRRRTCSASSGGDWVIETLLREAE
jgi:hypothetical protein